MGQQLMTMMMGLQPEIPDDSANQWRYQLDQFVAENQVELAALAWGLSQEWGDSQDTLGIDLMPQPHFVCCSKEAIEQLNKKTDHKIQEILGIIDGAKLDEEVVILAIGKGQLKLINFLPDPAPPLCFQEVDQDLTELMQHLEQKMLNNRKLAIDN